MTEQIEVGELRARDLGRRVLITDGDTVVEGTLEGFWVDHNFKREPKFTHLEVTTESGEFKLKNPPLDYVIQIAPEQAGE
ncbi:hypothetical protein [Agromyces sp. NBRC 114283]|uniref:hypothetical protein n=1 Tax=Agromyces sp. NBRC 114283 TaxID=2994521 RepID=UPI0024A5CC14|nr:hypothetical protein [Agromyces sp. NBRC 114283]GLU88936.1 hypothetical protein Agsp01_11910 [Agromyces sp. NBRC 114283]